MKCSLSNVFMYLTLVCSVSIHLYLEFIASQIDMFCYFFIYSFSAEKKIIFVVSLILESPGTDTCYVCFNSALIE